MAPPPTPPATLDEPRKRWTTAEFDRLLALGVFESGGPEYLWDGEIIIAMSENQPHVNAVANLLRLLLQRIPEDGWTINQGSPVQLMEGYKPQPDFTVLAGPRDRYETHVPMAADVALVIEVSDTSQSKDFGPFLRKYAEAGIPVYWVVDIPRRRIEVYEGPTAVPGQPAAFTVHQTYGLEAEVPLVIRHSGVAYPFGAIRVRDVLRNSLGPIGEGAGR
jgi:Uma2 family endonuclease